MAEIIIERPTMQKVIYKLEEDMQSGYQTPNQYKVVFLLIMITLIINNKKHDTRIAIFTKCYIAIAIDSVSIGLLFRKYDMIDIA
jgi:hypothetical protein